MIVCVENDVVIEKMLERIASLPVITAVKESLVKLNALFKSGKFPLQVGMNLLR